MPTLMGGNGVLHAKFWIVDSRHVYIGSANMDWKSLSEVTKLPFWYSFFIRDYELYLHGMGDHYFMINVSPVS